MFCYSARGMYQKYLLLALSEQKSTFIKAKKYSTNQKVARKTIKIILRVLYKKFVVMSHLYNRADVRKVEQFSIYS